MSLIGEIRNLGKYELIEEIGRGGMGWVYKARNIEEKKIYALKILPPELVAQEDVVERFHREASAMAKLSHPHIIEVYYVGRDKGFHFFAMECYQEPSLSKILQHKRLLSAKKTLYLSLQLANALAYAHAQGVIHRDIKPENVLVNSRGIVKITDFGIALMSQDNRLTADGEFIGTLHYMAPEHVRGDDLDARVDVYALGAMLYEMLSGHQIFEDYPPAKIIGELVHRKDDFSLHFPKDVPLALTQIVKKAFCRDLNRRYPSVARMWFDLVELQQKIYPEIDVHWLPEIISDDSSRTHSESHFDSILDRFSGPSSIRSSGAISEVVPIQNSSQNLSSRVNRFFKSLWHWTVRLFLVAFTLLSLGGLCYAFYWIWVSLPSKEPTVASEPTDLHLPHPQDTDLYALPVLKDIRKTFYSSRAYAHHAKKQAESLVLQGVSRSLFDRANESFLQAERNVIPLTTKNPDIALAEIKDQIAKYDLARKDFNMAFAIGKTALLPAKSPEKDEKQAQNAAKQKFQTLQTIKKQLGADAQYTLDYMDAFGYEQQGLERFNEGEFELTQTFYELAQRQYETLIPK